MFFVEQNDQDPFNRAKLMNVGVIESVKLELGKMSSEFKEKGKYKMSNYVI